MLTGDRITTVEGNKHSIIIKMKNGVEYHITATYDDDIDIALVIEERVFDSKEVEEI